MKDKAVILAFLFSILVLVCMGGLAAFGIIETKTATGIVAGTGATFIIFIGLMIVFD